MSLPFYDHNQSSSRFCPVSIARKLLDDDLRRDEHYLRKKGDRFIFRNTNMETAAELAALKNLGCAWAQGYLFAKPMAACDIGAWLEGEQLKKAQAV
ncbi:hypothetical protein [Xanthomonas euvesicatoria]|uniref:hypothetical protein n=1 Tax=Xanthomonas euvesicatoria TaxID=456327 RepID=UPI002404E296|nr:hypothetical protein [Xanthomonas euvesicatoria]MCP3042450.1 hypothetical protein [Xanthomonas euvesicatoria pv. allii]